ncbi:glucose-6-phosphate isomerase [Mycoplasma marinum]|uniref:Glucose-6-phosphate isomerase n=1 Tax=Mycoplasma marinum TaxID=1937190 RepID=A0A4R0XR89_9MOLU|nr:glucose-6-phosphate isomerase [Mycoplasma marinum]TCG10910.1 glucose-6-phosphate isomerase [Mycoplasma marinum]
MIKINLEKAVTEHSLKKYNDRVKAIHNGMENYSNEGSDFLGWKDLPSNYNKEEFKLIKQEAKRLKNSNIELLVVIGIGGSYLGAKAGIDFVQGNYSNKRDMEVMFVGESISSTDLAQKLSYAQNKQFAINMISKSGGTTEPALAFRLFRKLLEEKLGESNASKYIFATTDANNGSLVRQAIENEWIRFVIPDNIGGRFSVMTPVGLFPMACAGLNIDKIMSGAQTGEKLYGEISEKNTAYQYAVARYILGKKFSVEMLVSYEPQLAMFNEWWKQLFGESEGKQEKGVLPTSAIFSTDLHSMGQFVQEGSKILFETVITVKEPNYDVKITREERDLDGLNYLVDKTVHDVNMTAFEGVTDAHAIVGKVPNIHLEIAKMNEETLGQLFYFFERACAMSAYLIGVNPFNQPGVEIYKSNMFRLLGKPGYSKEEK